MTIIHPINDFLFEIFPELRSSGDDRSTLKETLEKYYTLGPYKPKVTVEKDHVKIEIDTSAIVDQHNDYQKAVRLCENSQYEEAKPLLGQLIEKNPTNSEYHRILGQALSEQGNHDDAIDSLIEALRWDPKNGWALIMMGNILTKDKKDLDTAKIYFDQATQANPNDHISANNIAAIFVKQGDYKTGKRYADKALEIDPTYPNTHYLLSVIAENDGDLLHAFNCTVEAIKQNDKQNDLKIKSISKAISLSQKLMDVIKGDAIVDAYRKRLEHKDNTKIELVNDTQITTLAKMEFAENYERDRHLLKYKTKDQGVQHLLMHELVHLDFVLEAQEAGVNQLFVSSQKHKKDFQKKYAAAGKRLQKRGLDEDTVNEYLMQIFQGVNSQIFNTPIDLFIEQKLYDEFPELRPYQFLSIYRITTDSVKATTDKKVIDFSPKDIVSKSKILSLILALQYKDLYGVDMINDFNATAQERQEAQEMYDEYLQYKDDKQPGEEYEIIAHWAEDLSLDANFDLVDENTYRKTESSDIDDILKKIEQDPLGLEGEDRQREQEMKDFLESREKSGVNSAVVMYMVGALQYFEKMPKDQIKQIAMEIALQGAHGYDTSKTGYTVSSIPNKTFTGFQILAYYYVSFKLAVPELVDQLGLPYEEEYQMAIQLFKKDE